MKYLILLALLFTLTLAETTNSPNLTQNGGDPESFIVYVLGIPFLILTGLAMMCNSCNGGGCDFLSNNPRPQMMMVPTSNYQMPQYAPIPQQEMMIADPKLQIVYIQPSM